MNVVSKDFFEIYLIAEIQAKNVSKNFLEYHFLDKIWFTLALILLKSIDHFIFINWSFNIMPEKRCKSFFLLFFVFVKKKKSLDSLQSFG